MAPVNNLSWRPSSNSSRDASLRSDFPTQPAMNHHRHRTLFTGADSHEPVYRPYHLLQQGTKQTLMHGVRSHHRRWVLGCTQLHC